MARVCVGGAAAALHLLPRSRRPASPLRQAVVATSAAETEKLAVIRAHAEANGVDVAEPGGDAARALEPALACARPLAVSLHRHRRQPRLDAGVRGDAGGSGAAFAFHAPLLRARAVDAGFELDVGGAEPMTLGCRLLINAAGSPRRRWRGRSTRNAAGQRFSTEYYAKGNYFSCGARAPFSRLIYPVPEPGGLRPSCSRRGSDRTWNGSTRSTTRSIRRARNDSIRRSGAIGGAAGGRAAARLCRHRAEDDRQQDFVIEGPRQHGVKGLINLFGIESPGLTPPPGDRRPGRRTRQPDVALAKLRLRRRIFHVADTPRGRVRHATRLGPAAVRDRVHRGDRKGSEDRLIDRDAIDRCIVGEKARAGCPGATAAGDQKRGHVPSRLGPFESLAAARRCCS